MGPLSELPCAQATYGGLNHVRAARLRHAVSTGRDHRSFGMIRQSNDSMRLLLPAQTSSSRMAMAAPPLSSAMRGVGARIDIAKQRLLASNIGSETLARDGYPRVRVRASFNHAPSGAFICALIHIMCPGSG